MLSNERALSEAEAEIYPGRAPLRLGELFRRADPRPRRLSGDRNHDVEGAGSPVRDGSGAAEATSLAMHERCRSSHQLASPDAAAPKLTKREIESCVGCTGKTDWEMSQLLGIAAPTVHFHVERAEKKLDATTRAQAVALLTLHGIS